MKDATKWQQTIKFPDKTKSTWKEHPRFVERRRVGRDWKPGHELASGRTWFASTRTDLGRCAPGKSSLVHEPKVNYVV